VLLSEVALGQAGENLQGIAFMAGAAASFAVFSALVKVIGADIPLFMIVFFRGGVAWLILICWERARHGRITPGANRRDLVIRSLLGFSALVMYLWAITHIELGLASALNQSSPIFVGIFAFLLLRERPHRYVPVLVLVGFAGATLIVSPGLRAVNIHATIGLTSAVASGLAYTWVRKLRTTDRPETIVRWFSGIVAALGAPIMLVQGWVAPSPLELLILAALGLLSLSGQLCLTWAYRKGQAAVVSPFIYLTVLLTLLAGWFFWAEWPGDIALSGAGLLVVSSIGIAVLAGREENSRGVDAPPAGQIT